MIAPILEQELGLQISVPVDLDTDQFGTFTREIARAGDQLNAARLKAQNALTLTGATLALASEGAFGPHPLFPYVPYNREIVLLLDTDHDLEVVGEAISTETNFCHELIETLEQAQEFADHVGFPEHGLVVMPDLARGQGEIVKGITTADQLAKAVAIALQHSSTGKIQIETDMRAMYNPTRMRVIEQATRDLVRKLQQACPVCDRPGFDIVDRRPGLPCALCHSPTELIRSVIYRCQACNTQQEVLFPNGAETADPAQCSYCNP